MSVKYFPGGNTSRGFMNLFDGISPSWEPPHYTFILKGSPGGGKSTLMKKIVSQAFMEGLKTEEFRCASDPESLDAVRIPEKQIIVIDGTSPHSSDPVIPGAGQEIVNLGHFRDHEKLMKKRQEIADLFAENKRHYSIAYSYLRAAAELKTCAIEETARCVDIPSICSCAREAAGSSSGKSFTPRKLFASAYTPDGKTDFSDSICEGRICVNISGPAAPILLKEIASSLEGTKSSFFMNPLLPQYPDMIVSPDGSTVFRITGDDDCDINLCKFITDALPSVVYQNEAFIRELTERALTQLALCKDVHDRIEAAYRPFIDYEQVNRESEILLSRIFS